MTSQTPPGGPPGSALDDAVTVPRARIEAGDEDPTNVLLSSSALGEVVEPVDQAGLEALVGRTISDRYLVHELIGSGGMGAVYRGEQVHLRKQVAIKILRPSAARMPELVLRFEREAVAGAHVSHPNVVAAIDFGQLDDKSHYLILDYVEGTPLKDVLAEGPMSVARSLALSRQIASALAAVHEKSIVHRDVKPQNILVAARDQVKLLDFGLAKVEVELLSAASRNAKPSPALTGAGTVMGTFSYMAPEAAKGMEAVDARSDLYALGVIMYEMLAGRRPFEEKDPVLLFKRQRNEDPPPLGESAKGREIPAAVEAIVMRLVQRDPQNRFSSANEVIAAIDAALESKAEEKPADANPDKPAEAPAPKSAAAPAKSPPAGTPKIVFLAAAAFLGLGLIVLLVVLLRGDSEEEKKTAPVAMAAPSATEATTKNAKLPTEIDGVDAQGFRDRMKKAILKKEWAPAARAFLALAKIDPELLTGKEMRGDVLNVVAGIGFETSFVESDQVFEVLTNDLGEGGIDILFHVVRTRGGSKASKRAGDILARPEVLSRASPALRVAIELRQASCLDKRALFGRAGDEGAELALDELLIAQQARCSPQRDPCCYREDEEIKAAIAKIRGRLH